MKAFQNVRPCIDPRDPPPVIRRTDKQAIAFHTFVRDPFAHSDGYAFATIEAMQWAIAINRLAPYDREART